MLTFVDYYRWKHLLLSYFYSKHNFSLNVWYRSGVRSISAAQLVKDNPESSNYSLQCEISTFAWLLKYSISEMAAFLLVVFFLQVPLPLSSRRQWKAEVSCFVLFIFLPWFLLGFFYLVDTFLFQILNNPNVISINNRSLKCGEKWRKVLRFFTLIFMDTSYNGKG